MYDLTVLMPCSTSQEKYIKRLNNFKKYGLLNLKNNKIKIILLADSNYDEQILSTGWEYDFEIVTSSYWHPAPKIYSFFANLKKRHIKETKWLFKVDDDSITNVDDLLILLNSKYNYNDSLYIISEKNCKYLNDYYREIMIECGLSNWINNNHVREFECSFSSQRLLFDLKNNKKVIRFLNRVVEKIGNDGYGDCIHSSAAREAGAKLDFLKKISWSPEWREFIKKERYHIHFIYNKYMDRIKDKNVFEEFSDFQIKVLFLSAKAKVI